ncbi:MAG: DUF488 domain-containing protein [Nocardioides sp.]
MEELLTVGHGTADAEELVDLLTAARVGLIVDVRRFPGSRRDPSVARDSLRERLPAAGIAYRWEERLGGRRRVPAGREGELDGWWRVEAFRAYAAYMRTEPFRAGLDELVAHPGDSRVAIMCSETLWWRCHRRLVSDAASLLHQVPVRHLAHDGSETPHPPSAGARSIDGRLYYPSIPAGE